MPNRKSNKIHTVRISTFILAAHTVFSANITVFSELRLVSAGGWRGSMNRDPLKNSIDKTIYAV
jgi:hypothetical protein